MMSGGVWRGVGGKYGNRFDGCVGVLGNLKSYLCYLDS